jgi:hypothetical protein
MKRKIQNSIGFVLILIITFSVSGFKSAREVIILDFSLQNVDGKGISTADFTTAKGFIVIFTCNHCPFAKLYTKRMNDLSDKYGALNVPLIAVNSMDTLIYQEEVFTEMIEKAKNDSFKFPYLQDASQSVGKSFGAKHTPTAYIIWRENNQWKVKYKGSIDDNGENPQLATPFIANAVDELLMGKPVSNPETESFGCAIFYRK